MASLGFWLQRGKANQKVLEAENADSRRCRIRALEKRDRYLKRAAAKEKRLFKQILNPFFGGGGAKLTALSSQEVSNAQLKRQCWLKETCCNHIE